MANKTETKAFFKENGKIQQIPKGSILYQEGTNPECVFYVQDGSFDLTRRDDDGQGAESRLKEERIVSRRDGGTRRETKNSFSQGHRGFECASSQQEAIYEFPAEER